MLKIIKHFFRRRQNVTQVPAPTIVKPKRNNLIYSKTSTLTVGKETHTIEDWAKITGLGVSIIHQRVRKGKTPTECISRTLHSTYTAFGQTKTISEWAKTTGMKADTIFSRIKSGLSITEALTRPIKGSVESKANRKRKVK